jgi:tetratricopeptide (TPR) repeat protein
MQLAARGRHEAALPLLERLLELPDMAHQDCARQLWVTRLRVLGAERAVNQRFVETGAGNWSYALGVILSDPDEVMDLIELPQDRRADFPRDALVALSTRYYERAQMQFEAFFATGEGNVRDGDIHTYSMNCNNLAIRYRYGEKRFEDALALHRKGLAASPFAEHKSGVMNCLYDLNRYADYVEAAEQLWHFSLEHGYSRHDPCDYFSTVAWTLQHLDRGHEIEIWLDRLREWRGMLDEGDLKENQPWLLGVEASMLDYLYRSKPEDTLARMQAIWPELMRIGRTWGLRRLADGLLDAGQPALALETYERAVAVFNPELDMEAARDNALQGIENARAAVRKQKPFWRRWL